MTEKLTIDRRYADQITNPHLKRLANEGWSLIYAKEWVDTDYGGGTEKMWRVIFERKVDDTSS